MTSRATKRSACLIMPATSGGETMKPTTRAPSGVNTGKWILPIFFGSRGVPSLRVRFASGGMR